MTITPEGIARLDAAVAAGQLTQAHRDQLVAGADRGLDASQEARLRAETLVQVQEQRARDLRAARLLLADESGVPADMLSGLSDDDVLRMAGYTAVETTPDTLASNLAGVSDEDRAWLAEGANL